VDDLVALTRLPVIRPAVQGVAEPADQLIGRRPPAALAAASLIEELIDDLADLLCRVLAPWSVVLVRSSA